MPEPTFAEWLAPLAEPQRRRAQELLARFAALGAADPEIWVRSEVTENIAQLTRYLVLRRIWPDHIDGWARDPGAWAGRIARRLVTNRTAASPMPDARSAG